jgi:ABC-type phosphate/phosphonate transport system permease subunit
MIKNLSIAIIGTVIGCSLSTFILFLCGISISFVATVIAIVISIIICFFINTRMNGEQK